MKSNTFSPGRKVITDKRLRMQYEHNRLSREKRVEIGRVIHRCNTLCNDINMIFYIPSDKKLPVGRHTYHKSKKFIELLIITKGEDTADSLYADWLIDQATLKRPFRYQHNLHIQTESEFLTAFVEDKQFQESVYKGIVVYDQDSQFIITLDSVELPASIIEYNCIP